MFYSVSNETEHPEEAARFVDHLVNDPGVGELVGNELGVPANLEVREHVVDGREGPEAQVTSFTMELEDAVVDGNPPWPVGAGEAVDTVQVIHDELIFGEITPDEAAERHIEAVEAALGTG
ncbi:hypothetical protein [Nocardiopsis sp. Huas11]|uniref:hypothetical protein n=1 Tax=Nocardiopsis sp. Huas11 TaxID=2183912 RepID=UPI000EB1D320|nr:hypothetical protein [Nocardiopsis sp. Huas11]